MDKTYTGAPIEAGLAGEALTMKSPRLLAVLTSNEFLTLDRLAGRCEFAGRGQQLTILALPEGTYTISLTHRGTGSVVARLYDPRGLSVGGDLVSAIGPYEGAASREVIDAGLYLFEVEADGDWMVRIEWPGRDEGGPAR